MVDRAENDLGPVYGHQCRHFNAPYATCKESYEGSGVDQLQSIIDDLKDFQGPLAGISKALNSCETKYLLVLPCDSPYIDSKLIDDMIAAMSLSDSDICVAHDGSIMHATFALMKSNLSTSLDKFLDSGGRKMALWYRQQNTKRVDVSNHLEVLTNLNSPEDF